MEMNSASVQIIADLLFEHTGQTLTQDRQWRIGTALSGLFRELGISNVDQLVCLLDEPDGARLSRRVVEAMLNNETYFFRDRAQFDTLAKDILPQLAERRRDAKRLSIWSAGCSTGQEVFSLAMLFAEQHARWDGWTIEIYGTDVSEKAICAARDACYSQFEIQRGLGVAQMISFFSETMKGWRPEDGLQRMVRFEKHNLLEPLRANYRFDLVLCRNVLLYFAPDTRRRAFERLSAAMADDAVLMLGAGETVVSQTDRFETLPGRQTFYRPAKHHIQHAKLAANG